MTSDQSYPAAACGPGCENALDHGRLRISTVGVSFEGAATAFNLPLEQLRLERAGATGDTIRLTHPAHAGWFISTGDLSILTNPILRSRADLRASLKSGRRKGVCCLGGCLAAILVLAGIVIALVVAKDALVGALARHFPPELEQRLGDALAIAAVPPSTRIDNPELTAGLSAIAQPVFDAIPKGDSYTSFVLHLSRNPEPNAFALPGGHIVVNSGLIELADTPEEIAGVLAHEAAHATLRHGLQSIISRAGTAALFNLLLGDPSGVTGVLVDSGGYLLNQKYSRDFERQADAKAWEYLSKANIDPSGLATFFGKLQKLQGSATPPAIVSTHPATQERVNTLNAKLKALPPDHEWHHFNFDFQIIKRMLNRVVPD